MPEPSCRTSRWPPKRRLRRTCSRPCSGALRSDDKSDAEHSLLRVGFQPGKTGSVAPKQRAERESEPPAEHPPRGSAPARDREGALAGLCRRETQAACRAAPVALGAWTTAIAAQAAPVTEITRSPLTASLTVSPAAYPVPPSRCHPSVSGSYARPSHPDR